MSQWTKVPDGTYVGGSEWIQAPDGIYVGGSIWTMAPEGTYVSGTEWTQALDRTYAAGSEWMDHGTRRNSYRRGLKISTKKGKQQLTVHVKVSLMSD